MTQKELSEKIRDIVIENIVGTYYSDEIDYEQFVKDIKDFIVGQLNVKID